MLFGRDVVDTNLSLGELLENRLKSWEKLNGLRNDYERNQDLVQKARLLGKMLIEDFRFSIFGKKFARAYLRQVGATSTAISTSISSNAIDLLNNKSYHDNLKNARIEIQKILESFIKEKKREIEKSKFLIRFAKGMKKDLKNRSYKSDEDFSARIAQLVAQQRSKQARSAKAKK